MTGLEIWMKARDAREAFTGDVAAVADDHRADLDQLLAQAGERSRLHRLAQRQRPHEVAEIVRQHVQLDANSIGGEGAA